MLTLESRNIITRIRDFWRDNLDSTNIHALSQMTFELYSTQLLENDVQLDAQGILDHFSYHSCDDLNSHTILNIAQSFVSKTIVAVNGCGLKDRSGKRAADDTALKAMERASKLFCTLKEKREVLISKERKWMR